MHRMSIKRAYARVVNFVLQVCPAAYLCERNIEEKDKYKINILIFRMLRGFLITLNLFQDLVGASAVQLVGGSEPHSYKERLIRLGVLVEEAMTRSGRAKERREKRLQEIAHLRKVPYTDAQRWWCMETVAMVTGSNRGIGYEIVRQLAVHGMTVVLTSRDITKGQEAVKTLQQEGLIVVFHQLDILNDASIKIFAEWIVNTYGGLDILVNNAGVNFNIGSENSVEFTDNVIATNYFGTKQMIETMIPLMKTSASGARIVNVSSRLGRLNGRRNRLGDITLRQQLAEEEHLCEELIDGMVAKFLEQVRHNNWTEGGWPQMFTDYSVSKLALNAYTRLVAKKLSARPDGNKIYINCYCPGWVKTAMTGWQGNISAVEGADTGVWVALLPAQPETTSKFFAERREISF